MYTKWPQVNGVAERIFGSNADSRLIYVMRNPALRSISHYWHNVHMGSEYHDLLDAIRADARYIDCSRYAMQLSPYLEVFPRDRLRLITFEALIHHTPETLRDVYAWLGVDDAFRPKGIHKKSNETPPVVLRSSALGVAVRRVNRRTLGSRFINSWARRILSRPCERARQDMAAALGHLRTELQPEIDQLESQFDRTLQIPEWDLAADS